MGESLRNFASDQAAGWRDFLAASVGTLLWLLGILVVLGVLGAAYLLISWALRRQERARCFLDLLETGLKQGRSLEQTILSLSQSRVHNMGVHFHLLAAYLEQGLPLKAALEKVPQFLPASVRAILRVGEEIGSVEKVLPAGRQSLVDGLSRTQTGLNNLIVIFFVSPIGPALIGLFTVLVFPKL